MQYIYYLPDENGCVDGVLDSVYVFNPSATFTYSVTDCIDSRLAFSFTNTSHGATNYYWSFGDLAATTAMSPSHTYSGYCLVNFPAQGTGIIKLISEFTATSCKSADSFVLHVGYGTSPLPQVILYAPDDLICLDNTADSYQWGYDNKSTLDSSLLLGEVNQDYLMESPDFSNKYYWVLTTHSGCLQKSYCNDPASVSNTAGNVTGISLFPNPVNNKINIEVQGYSGNPDMEVKLFDMTGDNIYKGSFSGGSGSIDVSLLSPGVYLLMVSDKGAVIATRTFVKK